MMTMLSGKKSQYSKPLDMKVVLTICHTVSKPTSAYIYLVITSALYVLSMKRVINLFAMTDKLIQSIYNA